MEAGRQAQAVTEVTQPEVVKPYSSISEVIVQAVALNGQGARNEADMTVASADSATRVTYLALSTAGGMELRRGMVDRWPDRICAAVSLSALTSASKQPSNSCRKRAAGRH